MHHVSHSNRVVRSYRRVVFALIFTLMLTLAGLSMLSSGALADTALGDLVEKVYLPLVIKAPKPTGTTPGF